MDYYDDPYGMLGNDFDYEESPKDDVCKHENKKIFEDGTGYCIDCGKSVCESGGSEVCLHESMYEDDCGMKICSKCRMEFEDITFEQEWKYYPDTSFDGKDPSRCHKTRQKDKTLADIFLDIRWEQTIAIRANVERKYNAIVKGATIRGKRRKAIVAVCMFYVMYDFDECRPSDFFRDKFGLTKKDMSDGFTEYHETFPDSRTVNIKPMNLLRWIMSLVEIPHDQHYDAIKTIAEFTADATTLLKRSSPQSVASAVVYFYVCLNPHLKLQLKLSKNKFADKVKLSDITVSKLVKEMEELAQCKVDM